MKLASFFHFNSWYVKHASDAFIPNSMVEPVKFIR